MKRKAVFLVGMMLVVAVAGFGLYKQASISDSSETPIKPQSWTLAYETKVSHSAFYAAFRDVENGVTVGYHGQTYVTYDRGESWVKGLCEANCRFGIDYYGSSVIWSVGNYGGNRVSINQGASFFEVTDLPLVEERANNLIDIVTMEQLWVGSPLQLAYSEDAGLTWASVMLPDGFEELAGFSFITPQHGFIVDTGGKIYETLDKGMSWTTLSELPVIEGVKRSEPPAMALRFIDDKMGYLVYLDKDTHNYAYSTLDGGATWSEMSLPATDRSAPYISEDGKTLTLLDALGRLKVCELSVLGTK